MKTTIKMILIYFLMNHTLLFAEIPKDEIIQIKVETFKAMIDIINKNSKKECKYLLAVKKRDYKIIKEKIGYNDIGLDSGREDFSSSSGKIVLGIGDITINKNSATVLASWNVSMYAGEGWNVYLHKYNNKWKFFSHEVESID